MLRRIASIVTALVLVLTQQLAAAQSPARDDEIDLLRKRFEALKSLSKDQAQALSEAQLRDHGRQIGQAFVRVMLTLDRAGLTAKEEEAILALKGFSTASVQAWYEALGDTLGEAKLGIMSEEMERETKQLDAKSVTHAKRSKVWLVLNGVVGAQIYVGMEWNEQKKFPGAPGVFEHLAAWRSDMVAKQILRDVAYADGRFTLSFHPSIANAGTVTYSATAKVDGGLDWKCTANAAMRRFVPEMCLD